MRGYLGCVMGLPQGRLLPLAFLLVLLSSLSGFESKALLNDITLEFEEVESVFEICADHEHQAICYRRELKTLMGQELGEEDQYPVAPVLTSYNVQGSIEGHSFNFEVETRRDFFEKCFVEWKRSRLIKADDIQVSFDFKPLRPRRNTGSYWKTAITNCWTIYDAIKGDNGGDLAKTDQAGIDVAFVLETFESQIFHNIRSPRQFTKICARVFKDSRLTKLDDAEMLVNNRRVEIFKNTGSWWRSALEICSEMRERIDF